MLIAAESMDEYSDIPTGFSRVIRDDKLFLVFSMGNIHYLMVAKKNFNIQD